MVDFFSFYLNNFQPICVHLFVQEKATCMHIKENMHTNAITLNISVSSVKKERNKGWDSEVQHGSQAGSIMSRPSPFPTDRGRETL